MTISATRRPARTDAVPNPDGYVLAELLIAACILLVIASAIFGMLNDLQHAGGYQMEIHSVLANTRIAMQTMERLVRQAGNDPLGCGAAGITIVGPQEMQIRADLTGSGGPGAPDKGDPDGDLADSGESVTIRYNAASRSLEVVPQGGPAQIVAGGISGLSFDYYDAAGNSTAVGSEVRSIRISVAGMSLRPDPKTLQVFGLHLESVVRVFR